MASFRIIKTILQLRLHPLHASYDLHYKETCDTKKPANNNSKHLMLFLILIKIFIFPDI